MNLLCIIRHRWVYVKDPETRYSKGGILMGHVDTGVRICQRCGKTEDVYRAASLFSLCSDDTGWLTYKTPEIRETVFNQYLPMAELTAWRLARDQELVAQTVGTVHERCGHTKLILSHSEGSFGKTRHGSYCPSCRTWEEWYETIDQVKPDKQLDRMYPNRKKPRRA